jgi:bifunctional non-homologous end joining protein LigD
VSGRSREEIEHGDVPEWTLDSSKKTQPEGGGKARRASPCRAVKPEFVALELATLYDEAPNGDGWLHEVKFDGYRIIGRKAGEEITLFSRSGLDWTVRFPGVASFLARMRCWTAKSPSCCRRA